MRKRRDGDDLSSLGGPEPAQAEEEEDWIARTPATSRSSATPPAASAPLNVNRTSYAPGLATLPPLDTGSTSLRRVPSSSSSRASSTALGSSGGHSLFSSYRDAPETPSTPAFSPYDLDYSSGRGAGPSTSSSFDAAGRGTAPTSDLRRSTSFLDVPSGGSLPGSSSRSSLIQNAYQPLPHAGISRSPAPGVIDTRSRSPMSPYSSFSTNQPKSGAVSTTSATLDSLSLQPPNQLPPPIRPSLGRQSSDVRLPPARELIQEADALMRRSNPSSSRYRDTQRRGPSAGPGWGR